MQTTHTTVHLPPVAALLRKAAVPLLESTLIPLGLFYLLFRLVGLDGGLFAALGWSLLALGRRIVLRKKVPAVLWLTTTLLVVRTVIGFCTGSVFLYFLQPTAQNFLITFALLATLPLKRPLLSKLADDFGVIPDTLSGHPHLQRVLKQISLLWALVFLVNGVSTLFVLATQTVGNFLMVSTAGSYSVVGAAILVSVLWIRRSMRNQGIALRLKLRWTGAQAAA
ncbi:VC0807 family protein [Sciscionella sediminilitoris]|uniref:VC0807 family protein n=1 Tax=Sciscionella sediminilitoris TaxID=1445613 RepID=UPI000B07AE88|nr:VC0807 family protein [Sciscionella sp. SE31]